MMELRISDALTLPLEAVTQTFGILAKRGVGKTYTAAVLAEEMLKARLQVVIADPIGVWWGLRAAADGKAGGLPIVVLGGDHGDLPLEVAGGSAIADLVVDERLSVVLDLSLFRKGEQTRFMEAFAETLYHRNRAPVHLVLDEADAFAPQRPLPGQQRLLGAIEDLVRRGRARGVGVSLITQRPAVLNKDVLTQIEVLVALRTISPQDRAAIDDWVKVHGTTEQREALMASLASLPIGTAWFWSPGWLDLFQRVEVRRRETFDSSATPKVGQKLEPPRTLADVDLSVLQQRLAATIEQAQANDPTALKHRLADLEKQLRERPTEAKIEVRGVRVEVPVIPDAQLAALHEIVSRLTEIGAQSLGLAGEIKDAILAATARPEPKPAPAPAAKPAGPPRAPAGRPPATAGISGPQQRILDALATFEALGLRDVARSNVAVWADQSPRSSGWEKNVSTLRKRGLIDYPTSGRLALTDQGRDQARLKLAIAGLEDLHEGWIRLVSGPQGRMLRALIDIYPRGISRADLAEASGQSVASSGFEKNVSTLRSLGLVDYPARGEVACTDLLFPAGLVRA